MHLDVSEQLEADPADGLEVQQRAATKWRVEFNEVRPHEAIAMRTPAQLYVRSSRRYTGIRPPRYPASYGVRRVSSKGCVRYMGKAVFISESLIGHDLGVRRTQGGHRIAIRFYNLDIGLFDLASAPFHGPRRFISLDQLPQDQARHLNHKPVTDVLSPPCNRCLVPTPLASSKPRHGRASAA
jgi:hypothetical protein